MPKLNTVRETKVVDLVVLEGGQVTVYVEPTAADVEKIMSATGEDKRQSILVPLSVLIKEWNINGDDDKPLPVTIENIGLLNYKDVIKITDAISLDTAALKKKEPTTGSTS